jgi:hypothetical protein
MALSLEEVAAFDQLHLTPGGVIFDATLGPLCVNPLRVLSAADREHILNHLRSRGWDDERAGRVNGAIELYGTLLACGVIERDPFPSR